MLIYDEFIWFKFVINNIFLLILEEGVFLLYGVKMIDFFVCVYFDFCVIFISNLVEYVGVYDM